MSSSVMPEPVHLLASYRVRDLYRLDLEQYDRLILAGVVASQAQIELRDGLVCWSDASEFGDSVHVTFSDRPDLPAVNLVSFTVEQYHQMLEIGVLQDGLRVELLDGIMVWKDQSAVGEDPMTIGDFHVLAVGLISDLNSRLEPHGCFILSQSPVTFVPRNEPEPDGAIVRGRRRDYARRKRTPADLLCVFEVSDSSLAHDRTKKLSKYASQGIWQFIIVNLIDFQIEIYEEPVVGSKSYAHKSIVTGHQIVSLRVGDTARLDIPAADLLP